MHTDELGGLGARSSGLTEAILRVSASLDVTTVLRGVVESARALTAARCGMIVTVDDSGQAEEFFSSGVEPAVHRRMEQWPDGPRLFEHFRNLPGPSRVPDLRAYVREVGFPTELLVSKRMQCAPLRHRDVQAGNFFLGELGEKDGGQQFTQAHVELLVPARLAGGDGRRQRPHAPRRAARQGRSRSPDRNLAGGVRPPTPAPRRP